MSHFISPLPTDKEEYKELVEKEINFFEKHKWFTYAVVGLAAFSLIAFGVFAFVFS